MINFILFNTLSHLKIIGNNFLFQIVKLNRWGLTSSQWTAQWSGTERHRSSYLQRAVIVMIASCFQSCIYVCLQFLCDACSNNTNTFISLVLPSKNLTLCLMVISTISTKWTQIYSELQRNKLKKKKKTRKNTFC